MKIAIIGSGIAGLSAAHALRGRADVTLFEAGRHFGGHANTVDLTFDRVTHPVDTGFLVFNERTYPGLISLFDELDVPSVATDMSFSVQVPGAFDGRPLEWSGTNLRSVFCQKRNLARPAFWRMLRDLLRFNALATEMVLSEVAMPDQTVAQFLGKHRFSDTFRDWYLLPMVGCIWSSTTEDVMRFPVEPLLRFCHNHGLLQVADRPRWFTVDGGSRRYVNKIVQGLADARLNTPVERVMRIDGRARVFTARSTETFDRVVFATHADDSLALLADPTPAEAALLGAVRYQRNLAVLHTDSSVLPQHMSAWAAWNYEHAPGTPGNPVCVHYLINKLQPLPWRKPVVVSLNPLRPIRAEHVHAQFDYAHPVIDNAAVAAQQQLARIQGQQGTWYCGAWTGYGFHEDGLQSGQAVARSVLLDRSFQEAEAVA